jgi:hypothetical protein
MTVQNLGICLNGYCKSSSKSFRAAENEKRIFNAQGGDGGRYLLFASQRVPHGAEEEIYIRKNKLVWSCAQTVIKSLTLPSEIVQVGWCCFLAEPQKDSRPSQHT